MRIARRLVLPAFFAATAVAAGACGAPPGIDAGAGGELEALFADAPPPRFRTLRRVEVWRSADPRRPEPVHREIVTELVRPAGWRSVARERWERHDEAKVTHYHVGPVGLFRAAGALDWKRGMVSLRASDRVRRVRDVRGALFPLAVGNRLSFETDEVRGEALLGSGSDVRGAYAFEVTGTTRRWAAASPAVPGEVFVIRRVSKGRFGRDEEAELHYSVALGAVIYQREDTGYTIDEIRLTGWD